MKQSARSSHGFELLKTVDIEALSTFESLTIKKNVAYILLEQMDSYPVRLDSVDRADFMEQQCRKIEEAVSLLQIDLIINELKGSGDVGEDHTTVYKQALLSMKHEKDGIKQEEDISGPGVAH